MMIGTFHAGSSPPLHGGPHARSMFQGSILNAHHLSKCTIINDSDPVICHQKNRGNTLVIECIREYSKLFTTIQNQAISDIYVRRLKCPDY